MPEGDALRAEAAGLRGEVAGLSEKLRIAEHVNHRQGVITRVLVAIVVALAVTSGVLTVLTVNAIGESARIRTQVLAAQATVFRTLQAQCQVWGVIAQIPITSTAASTTFTLIAGARRTYETLECSKLYGPLPPIDPRVVPYYEKLR